MAVVRRKPKGLRDKAARFLLTCWIALLYSGLSACNDHGGGHQAKRKQESQATVSKKEGGEHHGKKADADSTAVAEKEGSGHHGKEADADSTAGKEEMDSDHH